MDGKFDIQRPLKYVKLMMIFLCCFVGVGFMSGAEIYQFFLRFKSFAILGIIAFFFIIFLLTLKIISPRKNNKKNANSLIFCKNNDEILNFNKHLNFNLKMYKKDNNHNKFTFLNKNFYKSIVVFLNVFLISAAMMSGLKNLIFQLFFNNKILIYFLCVLALFLLVFFGVKGLEKIDVFVLIFVAIIVIYFCKSSSLNLKTLINLNHSISSNTSNFSLVVLSIVFSLLYVFMNIMQLEPIAKISGVRFTKKSALCFSLIFASLLSVILFVFVVFLSGNSVIWEESMPFLSYFEGAGGFMHKFFPLGLLLALISTLVTCLVGVKTFYSSYFEKKVFASSSSNFFKNCVSSATTLIFCMIFSLLPFAFYIKIVYPFLGAINLLVFIFC